jgi:hypothetical protein
MNSIDKALHYAIGIAFALGIGIILAILAEEIIKAIP